VSNWTWYKDQSGATAVEYAIIASLVAAIIVGIVTLLGLKVVSLFALLPGTF